VERRELAGARQTSRGDDRVVRRKASPRLSVLCSSCREHRDHETPDGTAEAIVTLQLVLKKALGIVRGEKQPKRAAYLQAGSSRYRLIPSEEHPRGYVISLSVRYNNEWQPWGEVESFGVDDILCDKWRVV
jgi:hypothetical protein